MSYPDYLVLIALTDQPEGRLRLFVDRLTPEQIEALGDAAEAVLAALDEPTKDTRVPASERMTP